MNGDDYILESFERRQKAADKFYRRAIIVLDILTVFAAVNVVIGLIALAAMI